MTGKHYVEDFRIPAGSRVSLSDFDPAFKGRHSKRKRCAKIAGTLRKDGRPAAEAICGAKALAARLPAGA